MRELTMRWILIAALLVAGLTTQGCFNPFNPRLASRAGVSEPPPAPNTPRGILDLFAWCWNHRAYEEYTELFTEDFQFQFGLADSAGNAYRDRALYRQDELDTARHLFIEGTASEPPATRINLIFQDRTFVPQRDSRPGKTYPVHQEIKRTVVLSIDTESQQYRITGAALFFLVRGDSAKIPEDLIRRGFGPDPNRWYIERWEDETIQSESVIAQVPEEHRAEVVRQLRGLAGQTTAALSAPAEETASAAVTWPLGVTWGRIKHVYMTR